MDDTMLDSSTQVPTQSESQTQAHDQIQELSQAEVPSPSQSQPEPSPPTKQGRRPLPRPPGSERAHRLELDRLKHRIAFVEPLDPELFNTVAQEAARLVAQNRQRNSPSQLRRFYDELTLWEAKASREPNRFTEFLPFIRMINAKVAYAQGRDLVDRTFAELMRHSLRLVTDAHTLTTCTLFWEAFLGFYKKERPSE
jgi:CRISPR-associated protein Csm2